MVSAVSKLMRNQDLVWVASKCRVITRFRNTQGLPGHMGVRCSPTIPPTTHAALPPPCWTACCTALAMR
jgi:ethanolamine ammonia-lyase large subunit